VPIECTACTRARPLCRYARIILRARRAAIVPILSLTFLRNIVAYVCRVPLDRIGIMLARLDNLPQRHRSVTLHAAALDVDFRASMRCERIPGRHDPCSRNSPSHARHAEAPATGISLAEIAGIIRSRQRPARAGPRDWHNACGNCGNPRHGPPARYRDRIEGRAERSERSETHFSGPYSGGKVFLLSNGTCSERVDDDALVPADRP
jgi:hypothetical protein